MLPESALIEKSKAGDLEAFDSLVRRYEDQIYRLAKSVCSGLPSDADDVYQETFLTAFKKLRGFREDSNLGTWLYRIASNLCLMRYRRKKREPFVPLLDLPHEQESDHREKKYRQFSDGKLTPEESASKKELVAHVAAALAGLPVEYRLILTLRDIEGLSNEETAASLNISLAAVKSRLHRGRLFLRDEFSRVSREPEKI